MSENNREGKRRARERLAVERERQKAGERRRRALIVSVAVAGVLALAAVVGVIAASGSGGGSDNAAGGPVATPRGAVGKDGLAIPVGRADAPSTLTVWEDFRCPACKQFEDGYRSTIHELTTAGSLRVEYHVATLIDKNMGGSGSLRAGNAAACAQQAGKFPAYHDVLYENQPSETDDAFADNTRLTTLARKVPGLDTPSFRTCVTDGTHDSWVTRSNKAFEDGDFQGTPTVLLDGKNVFADQQDPLTPEKLRDMVEKAAS